MHEPGAVIIGYGRMGREHEQAYAALGIPVVAKADRANWREAIDRQPGYVSICSYDDAHAEQISFALANGHKVIAEKPLCLTRGQLEYLAQFKDANLSCHLPLRYQRVFDPLMVYGRDAYHIECDYNWGRAHRIGGWRSQSSGYSFVLGAGVHVFDLIQTIAHCKIATVQAVGQMLNLAQIGCETFIAVIGQLENSATFRANINCAFDGNHEHRATIWQKDGPISAKNDHTDKLRALKALIRSRLPEPAFEPHCVAFAVQRAMRSGTKERVEYL